MYRKAKGNMWECKGRAGTTDKYCVVCTKAERNVCECRVHQTDTYAASYRKAKRRFMCGSMNIININIRNYKKDTLKHRLVNNTTHLHNHITTGYLAKKIVSVYENF